MVLEKFWATKTLINYNKYKDEGSPLPSPPSIPADGIYMSPLLQLILLGLLVHARHVPSHKFLFK